MHISGLFSTPWYRRLATRHVVTSRRFREYACPQEVKLAAYKGLVLPVLEYSGSVWDSSGVGLQDELENC